MEKLLTIGLLIFASLLIGLLMTYVIVDVTHLYQIPYLINFNFVQVYGLTLVYHFFTYEQSRDTEKSTAPWHNQVIKAITALLTRASSILLSWWFAYIMFKFIS